jgi:hypothetical protein
MANSLKTIVTEIDAHHVMLISCWCDSDREACAASGSYSLVAMMQPSDLRQFDDRAQCRGLNGS